MTKTRQSTLVQIQDGRPMGARGFQNSYSKSRALVPTTRRRCPPSFLPLWYADIQHKTPSNQQQKKYMSICSHASADRRKKKSGRHSILLLETTYAQNTSGQPRRQQQQKNHPPTCSFLCICRDSGRAAPVMPKNPRRTRPCWRIWDATHSTLCMGTENDMFCAPAMIAATIAGGFRGSGNNSKKTTV